MLSVLLATSLLVPLSKTNDWLIPPFDKKKGNRVEFSHHLEIKVEDSSSPLFYQLPKPLEVRTLIVDGQLSGLPRLTGKTEGKGDGDDFALRVGLVSPGERPNWFSRLFLSRWMKDLLELSKERGFSEVHFFNVSQQLTVGSTRKHPSLKDAHEEMVLQMRSPGNFGFRKELPSPISTSALWIQADGEDTHSTFTVRLNRIQLSANE